MKGDRCDVCNVKPRMIMLYGGGYWHTCLGEQLCLSCGIWAQRMGLPAEQSAHWTPLK